MSILHFRSKIVVDSKRISVKDRDWTLQITKVQKHDGRTMFLLQPVQERFIQLSSAFLYDKIKPAIWLTVQEFSVLIKALKKLEDTREEADLESGEASSR